MTTSYAASVIEKTERLLSDNVAATKLERVSFRLWDGRLWPDNEPRAATIVLKHPEALREMMATGTEMGLAEAYMDGHFEVEGDLETACGLADALTTGSSSDWLSEARHLFHLRRRLTAAPGSRVWIPPGLLGPSKHSKARDRRAISHHYDLSNDFYRLWLDSKMLYSCGYFEEPGDDLETGQTAKLQHIFRKLRLKPGMRLLDLGCGWGGLAIHAAKYCGVRVTGVTLSQQQASVASAWVSNSHLESEVGIELKDYRDLDEPESFDAVVSVGMAEHVGADNLEEYFARAYGFLKPAGVFLNHAIGDGARARTTRGESFIQEYVFPDSDLPKISQVLSAAESAGFEVRDVENLREHYTLTLRHWMKRLEASREAALKFVDEPTYRLWRLYLAASAYGFDCGRLAVYQTLLSKPDEQGRARLPLTRRDWYEGG